MTRINVVFFALARDLAGTAGATLDLPAPCVVSVAVDELLARYPSLSPMREHLRMAVNSEYVGVDHVLRDNDELAVIPPVSGG